MLLIEISRIHQLGIIYRDIIKKNNELKDLFNLIIYQKGLNI